MIWRWEAAKRVLHAVPQQWLVSVQLFRALGAIFLILSAAGWVGDDPARPTVTAAAIRHVRAGAMLRSRDGSKSVGGDEDGIEPEELWNLPLVVGEVLVEGGREGQYLALSGRKRIQQRYPVSDVALLSAARRDAVATFENELWLWFFAGIVKQRWPERKLVIPPPQVSWS